MIQIEEMKIYILNTTRFYHEDFEEYPGAWFSCPVNFEEIRERLGVQSEEEIEIEDYELPFPLEGNTRLWEINALCRMVQEMQGTPLYYEMDVVQNTHMVVDETLRRRMETRLIAKILSFEIKEPN